MVIYIETVHRNGIFFSLKGIDVVLGVLSFLAETGNVTASTAKCRREITMPVSIYCGFP